MMMALMSGCRTVIAVVVMLSLATNAVVPAAAPKKTTGVIPKVGGPMPAGDRPDWFRVQAPGGDSKCRGAGLCFTGTFPGSRYAELRESLTTLNL